MKNDYATSSGGGSGTCSQSECGGTALWPYSLCIVICPLSWIKFLIGHRTRLLQDAALKPVPCCSKIPPSAAKSPGGVWAL
ncbi:hypothetical protein I7I50_07049 [Histoplasma capsulatum G186AR]|uniref:Uncharacterized protein n=1 Tax=Ajellomyces capsulatus TaxID=5037 RepID=A0A8H8D2S7_AJECA|nr:hypothetical protein I7I52_09877 [Histoplasma capsulatum]QSS67850.1 hypothetical protein I7I50_07049 [Histoplasma capsulatum G186AR]